MNDTTRSKFERTTTGREIALYEGVFGSVREVPLDLAEAVMNARADLQKIVRDSSLTIREAIILTHCHQMIRSMLDKQQPSPEGSKEATPTKSRTKKSE